MITCTVKFLSTQFASYVLSEVDGKAVSEEYTVRGLDAGTLYEVAVRAFNRAGLGPLSSPRIVRATQYGGARGEMGRMSSSRIACEAEVI